MGKFKYGETVLLNKGTFNTVKVGIRFDSKVINNRRNKSKISYFVEGYDLRNWCYEEELSRMTLLHKLIFLI